MQNRSGGTCNWPLKVGTPLIEPRGGLNCRWDCITSSPKGKDRSPDSKSSKYFE